MGEGNSPPRIVIIEFPSMDASRQFYLQNTRAQRPFARAQPEERHSLSKGRRITAVLRPLETVIDEPQMRG
jgi:hypothetical protein